jgi:hypothetical protein
MTKKTESALGLVPAPTPPGLGLVGVSQAFGVVHASTQKELQIVDLWHEQTLVIDAVASKTLFGFDKMAGIHQHAALEFVGTAAYIDDLKQGAFGTGYQAAVDEFGHYMLQEAARHLLVVVGTGDAGIAAEIERPLRPPPEPEQRRGFLARLFGG